MDKKKVIFICTGNACRSQMAEGLLRHMAGDKFEVYSAGSHPSRLHPASVAVMAEWGIDIARHTAEPIDDYLETGIDIVITVCDNAQQICPTFPGNVKRIHWGLDDPYHGWGAEPEDLLPYREIRDELKDRIKVFLTEQNKKVKG
jgi:arsenate reductase